MHKIRVILVHWKLPNVLERNTTGRLSLSNFKTYNKGTVIKTRWYRHNNRRVDRWDQIESSEISKWVLQRHHKNMLGKKMVCWMNGARTITYSCLKHFLKMKNNIWCSPHTITNMTSTNLEWLFLKSETINSLSHQFNSLYVEGLGGYKIGNYIDLHLKFKITFYSWNKCHLAIMYFIFFIYSVGFNLVRNFLFYRVMYLILTLVWHWPHKMSFYVFFLPPFAERLWKYGFSLK